MVPKPAVAYVGLGIMGRPAAMNLLRGGHELHIYARQPATAQPLVEAGAIAHESPAAAAAQAIFAFTNVSDSADVEQVVLGPSGFVEGLKPDSVVIDMSTIAPATARHIAAELGAREIAFLDAPVSGGEQGAKDGTLAFMVGGEQAVFERARPLLELMGSAITLVGTAGAGQIAKICNQVIIAGTINAVAEAFRLAERMDTDPARVRDAIAGGFAGSKVLQIHAQRMITKDFTPGFKAVLHQKDLGIALAAARAAGVSMPSTDIFLARLERMIAAGHGEQDSSVASLALAD